MASASHVPLRKQKTLLKIKEKRYKNTCAASLFERKKLIEKFSVRVCGGGGGGGSSTKTERWCT